MVRSSSLPGRIAQAWRDGHSRPLPDSQAKTRSRDELEILGRENLQGQDPGETLAVERGEGCLPLRARHVGQGVVVAARSGVDPVQVHHPHARGHGRQDGRRIQPLQPEVADIQAKAHRHPLQYRQHLLVGPPLDILDAHALQGTRRAAHLLQGAQRAFAPGGPIAAAAAAPGRPGGPRWRRAAKARSGESPSAPGARKDGRGPGKGPGAGARCRSGRPARPGAGAHRARPCPASCSACRSQRGPTRYRRRGGRGPPRSRPGPPGRCRKSCRAGSGR